MKDTRIKNLQSLIEAGKSMVSNAQATGSNELWKTIAAGESISRGPQFTGVTDSAAINYGKVYAGAKLSHAARVASAIIMGAAGHEAEFVSKPARESADSRYSDYMPTAMQSGLAGSDGDYGKTPIVATEYYSNKDLDQNLGLTWSLNVRALETQSAFAEKLYPTITVENNDVGITIRTKVTTVTRGILNALLEKDVVTDNRRPLHNALTDHTVLQDDAIRIIPYKMETGDNAAAFIPDGLVDDEIVTLGRCPAYPTNYLSFAAGTVNLFQLSAHPGIVAEGYDETDEIAPGVALGSLLLSVREKTQNAAAGSKMSLDVRDMQFATFQRPAEGDGRELVLQFRRTQFALTGDTRDIKGAEMPALAALKAGKYTLKYSMAITASLFVNGPQSGKLDFAGSKLTIESLHDAAGTTIDITKGSGKTIVDNLTIEMLGYKIDATRTNENRRSQGLLLDPIWEQENYKLQYGSPIMTKSPIGVEYDDAERLDDLISAINIRNEMLAITSMMSYTQAVKLAYASMITPWDKPAIRGLGRHWVAPWYEELDFPVDKLVQSLETKDALINARQALVQQIGDQVCRAIQESRYMPAIRLLTANPNALPVVVIATDEPTASMLLLTQGDQRLLGDRYQYEVVTTNDDRWRVWDEATKSWTRRLQWVLKVDGVDDTSYCVLNWGNHFWSPIMVTNINIQRNGATSKELAAQPRNAHICHCPITGLIWIKGITDLVAKKLAYNVTTTALGAGGNIGALDAGAQPKPASGTGK